LFSERVADGARTVGEALMMAKRHYYAGRSDRIPDEEHQKSGLEATLYGLPMMKLQAPGAQRSSSRIVRRPFISN